MGYRKELNQLVLQCRYGLVQNLLALRPNANPFYLSEEAGIASCAQFAKAGWVYRVMEHQKTVEKNRGNSSFFFQCAKVIPFTLCTLHFKRMRCKWHTTRRERSDYLEVSGKYDL